MGWDRLHHPPKPKPRGGTLLALGVQRPSFAHSPGPGFSLTYPLPRPQIMCDLPSATQHLTVLVGHHPKVPFAPRHVAQRPDQGEAKALWSSHGSPKEHLPVHLCMARELILASHQHTQPSDQVSCTARAALPSCSSSSPQPCGQQAQGQGHSITHLLFLGLDLGAASEPLFLSLGSFGALGSRGFRGFLATSLCLGSFGFFDSFTFLGSFGSLGSLLLFGFTSTAALSPPSCSPRSFFQMPRGKRARLVPVCATEKAHTEDSGEMTDIKNTGPA